MSSLLTKPLVRYHRSRVSPIQLRDFPLDGIVKNRKKKEKRGGIQQKEKKKQMARMASRDASNMPRRYAGLGPSSARTASQPCAV